MLRVPIIAEALCKLNCYYSNWFHNNEFFSLSPCLHHNSCIVYFWVAPVPFPYLVYRGQMARSSMSYDCTCILPCFVWKCLSIFVCFVCTTDFYIYRWVCCMFYWVFFSCKALQVSESALLIPYYYYYHHLVSMCGDSIAGQGELQLSPCVEMVLLDMGNWTVFMCGDGIELSPCVEMVRIVSICRDGVAGHGELNCPLVCRRHWTVSMLNQCALKYVQLTRKMEILR